MKKKIILLLAVSVLFLGLSSAHADSISLTYHQPNPAVIVYTSAFTTYAGLVTFTGDQNLSGFCVENALISNNQTASFGLTGLINLGLQQAAWIAENYGETNAVAAQLAIWRVMFGENFSLLGSTATTYGTTYNNILSSLGTNRYTGDGWLCLFSPYNDGNPSYGVAPQDFIVRNPNPVPEPATMLLLGLGLIGLAGYGRKRFKS